jgi:hypothetical protein
LTSISFRVAGAADSFSDLDLLCGAFADEQIVLALDVLRDGLVHRVARDTD